MYGDKRILREYLYLFSGLRIIHESKLAVGAVHNKGPDQLIRHRKQSFRQSLDTQLYDYIYTRIVLFNVGNLPDRIRPIEHCYITLRIQAAQVIGSRWDVNELFCAWNRISKLQEVSGPELTAHLDSAHDHSLVKGTNW